MVFLHESRHAYWEKPPWFNLWTRFRLSSRFHTPLSDVPSLGRTKSERLFFRHLPQFWIKEFPVEVVSTSELLFSPYFTKKTAWIKEIASPVDAPLISHPEYMIECYHCDDTGFPTWGIYRPETIDALICADYFCTNSFMFTDDNHKVGGVRKSVQFIWNQKSCFLGRK